MKMNKKGFTLLEVMAVIIILGILVTLGVSIYRSVYTEQQEKVYKNKISGVVVAAEKWAEEMNIGGSVLINVKTLINDSFLQADSLDDSGKPVFDDPRNKDSLLCNLIYIQSVNGEYDIEFKEEKNCDLNYTGKLSDLVVIEKYTVIDNVVSKFIGEDNNWTNSDVLIYSFVKDINLNIKGVSYHFANQTVNKNSSNIYDGLILSGTNVNDLLNYDNVYLVNSVNDKVIDEFLEVSYDVINDETREILNNNTIVQIDKQKPNISYDKSKLTSTSGSSKMISFNSNDFNGSGVNKIFVSNSSLCVNDMGKSISSIDASFDLNNGEYVICSEDNVGNISNVSVTVSGIDDSIPTCELLVNGYKADNESEWFVDNVTVSFKGDLSKYSKFGISTSSTPVYNGKSSVIQSSNTPTEGIVYYGFITNNVGKTAICEANIKLDKDKPVITTNKATAPPKTEVDPYKYLVINDDSPSGTKDKKCELYSENSKDYYRCTVIKNNGLSTTSSAEILHNYTARKESYPDTCTRNLYGSWVCTWGTFDSDTSGQRYYSCTCTADASLSCTRYVGHENDCRGNCGVSKYPCTKYKYYCDYGGKLNEKNHMCEFK